MGAKDSNRHAIPRLVSGTAKGCPQYYLIQPRFNLVMRRPVDSGNQRRSQVAAKTAADLATRGMSCRSGLAAERPGRH